MTDPLPDAARIVNSAATVSDKIRALDAAGYSRAAIARMLGKRYQHVRNVLEADAVKHAAAASSQGRGGVAESGAGLRGSATAPTEPQSSGGTY